MNPEVLEKYRKRKKLLCSEVSARVGRSPSWYTKVRTGQASLRANYIPQLADLFGVKPETLAKEYFAEMKVEDSSTYVVQTK